MSDLIPMRLGKGPVKVKVEIDPETEQVILARLATFDEDAKSAVPAREALAGIRKNLKQLAIG